MNPEVDVFFEEGCGRCRMGGTPACKIHTWQKEARLLRQIILETGLNEDRKWGFPCYTLKNKNILMLAVFKNYCSVSFFKGALLKDPEKLLISPGENSNSVRQIRCTEETNIMNLADSIKRYIYEAVEIEKAGLKVPIVPSSATDVPLELQHQFDEDATFKTAFEALTPGRQRGYLLYFSAAKQPQTRRARIEKYKAHILQGKGFHDR